MEQHVQKDSQPPQPPPFPRKIQLHRVQLIGMPLLMLIPLLALFGVFGETFATVEEANATLAVEVTYATRYRYKLANPLEVSVHNRSADRLSVVEVRLTKAYIDQFSGVSFTPQPEAITDEFYIIELHDLAPTETRVVSVTLQGEEYWRHTGRVVVSTTGTQPVTLPLVTWIFP
jgi:hypothetical protein